MALSIGELVGYVDLDTTGVSKGVDRIDGALGKTRSGFTSLAKVAAGALAGLGAMSFFGDALGEAEEAMKVGAQTEAVIKSTGSAAQVTAAQVGDLASSLSAKTGIDDEAIQSGQNLLLTFKNIKNEAGKGNDIFDQTTRAMVDMSAAMGTDAKGSAIQLGKALNDPVKGISALARVGVSFTEAQKKQIESLVKAGDTMSAQKIILKELESQFGGTAKAIATPADKARVAWGNFKEQVGAALMPTLSDLADLATARLIPAASSMVESLREAAPAFQTVAGAVGSVLGFLRQHQTLALSVAAGIGALVAITAAHGAVLAVTAAGGMVAWLKSTTLISTATKVWAAVQWVLNAALTANPIGLVVVALVALGVAITVAWKKSETFRSIVTGAWNAIKAETVQAFEKVKSAVSTAFDFLKGVFLNFTGPGLIIKHWNTIKTVTTAVWEALKGEVSGAIEAVKGAIGGLAAIPGKVGEWFGRAKDAVVEKWNQVVSFVGTIPGRITSTLGNLGSLLYNAGASILQGLIDGIQSKINTLTSKLRAITDLIPKNKGPESKDKKLLRPNGKLIMQGLVDGIVDGTAGLKGVLAEVTEGIGKKKLAKITEAVDKEYARGVKVGKKLTRLGEDIKAAKDKLTEATATRDDWLASLMPPSAIESARQRLSELTQLRDQMFTSVRDAAVSYASLGNVKVEDGKALTSDAVVSQLTAKLESIKTFRANMATLLAQGLDKASYQQMLADGVEKAGAMAEVLVNDPAAVTAVASLSTQIQEAATGLAADGSTNMYQAGVDTAQALVTSLTNQQTALYEAGVTAAAATLAGLESQETTLVDRMTTIGQKMAAALAAALGVSDASVMDGVKGIPLQGKGPGGGKGGKDKGGKDKDDKRGKNGREAPLIGAVYQSPNQSTDQLAEALWLKTRSRG